MFGFLGLQTSQTCQQTTRTRTHNQRAMFFDYPFGARQPAYMPRTTHTRGCDDVPYTYRRAPSVRSRSPSYREYPQSEAGPKVRLCHSSNGYEVRVEAEGNNEKLHETSASVKQGKIALSGFVLSRQQGTEYYVTCRSGVFATPSRARVVGLAPAGIRITGTPHSNAWVEMREGFIPSEVLHPLRGRESDSQPFNKLVDLPTDADVTRAVVSSPAGATAFTVHVPKKRVVAPPRDDAVAPTSTKPEPLKPMAKRERQESEQASVRQQERPAPAQHERPAPAPQHGRSAPAPQHERSAPAPHYERSAPAPHYERSAPAQQRECQTKQRECHTTPLHAQLSSSDPVLIECGVSDAANIQSPREGCMEEWQAMPSGGFLRMEVC